VFVIVDNGSDHRGQAAIKRLRDAWPNTIMIHTPVHASWLNQEIFFSIIQKKAITPNDFASLEALSGTLRASTDRYNVTARPFNWKFTAADLTALLRRISEREHPGQQPAQPADACHLIPRRHFLIPPAENGSELICGLPRLCRVPGTDPIAMPGTIWPRNELQRLQRRSRQLTIRCGKQDRMDVIDAAGQVPPDAFTTGHAGRGYRGCGNDLVGEELPPQQAGVLTDLGEHPLKSFAALAGRTASQLIEEVHSTITTERAGTERPQIRLAVQDQDSHHIIPDGIQETTADRAVTAEEQDRHRHARTSGNRPCPVPVRTGQPVRP